MNNDIIGSGGGKTGGSQRTPIEAPDSLQSISYAKILDLWTEGEIQGFPDPAHPYRYIYLNETRVENADGSFNFKNIQFDYRLGTQTQDYIRGFDTSENEIAVGVELRDDNNWTRAVTNLNLSAIRVRLSVPALSSINAANGDVNGHTVGYKIELAVDGGAFVQKYNSAFTGKTTTKFERAHRIDLPIAATGWTVRVTRTTPNANSGAIQDTMGVESYAELIDAKLRYPMAAMGAITVDAQQFGNIPSRAFDLLGRIIRIPSNYNPTTRVYTGIWDGTFQVAYSNNPAWCYYDLVTNPRYGLGHLVTESQINKWALYKIAVYCDGLVPDGLGGTEPRFTCNLYLQSQNDATKVLQDISTIFRGITYAANGSIYGVSDMPEDSIYQFNPSNVVDGKFGYSGASRRVRHTVALVSWSDLNDFGRAKVEYIDDPEGIARYGPQETQVIAVGATSQGQARRLGKYILTTERYETNAVTFSVGLDGMIPAPGKIIDIADPLRAGDRQGGRVASASIDSINVDRLPNATVNFGDTLTVVLPNGTLQVRNVVTNTGNTIIVAEPFDAVPLPGSVWILQNTASEPGDVINVQKFRVITVLENPDGLSYSINAIQHNESKFDFIENDLAIEVPQIGVSVGRIVPAPENLTFTQADIVDYNTAVKVGTLAWDVVPGATDYSVEWRANNGAWSNSGKFASHTYQFDNLASGILEVKVAAYNAINARSNFTVGGPYTIVPVEISSGAVIAANVLANTAFSNNSPSVANSGFENRLIDWEFTGGSGFSAESGDIDYSHNLLLSHFNGANGATSFSDDVAGAWTIFGGAQLTTATPTFGSARLQLIGTSDYITIPSAGNELGSGDFTISFVVNVDSNDGANYRAFIQNDNISVLRGWLVILDLTTKYLTGRVDTDTGVYDLQDSVAFPTGVDVLVTMTRVSDVLYLLKNGVVVNSRAITGTVNAPSTPITIGGLTVGGSVPATTGFIGKIDELIIRKKAIWTSFPFTPPTTEFGGVYVAPAVSSAWQSVVAEAGIAPVKGTRMLKFYDAAYSGDATARNIGARMNVVAGQRISESISVATNSGTGTVQLLPFFYDATDTLIITKLSLPAITPSTTWKPLRLVCSAPENAVYARFGLSIESYTSGAWYFDDCQMQALPAENTTPTLGDNLCTDGGFDNNIDGAELPQDWISETYYDLSRYWRILECTRPTDVAVFNEASYAGFGNAHILIGTTAVAFSLPAGQSGYCAAGQDSSIINVMPGEKFAVKFRANWTYNIAIPAGIDISFGVGLRLFNAAGTFLSNETVGYLNQPAVDNSVAPYDSQITIPANAATGFPYFFYRINNPTGAAIAITAIPGHIRLDDVKIGRVLNLDTGVVDGPINGRVDIGDLVPPIGGGGNRIGVQVQGSNLRIGDQRNLPQSNTTAYGSVRSTTALSADSSGNVTVNAHTVLYGATSVSYSAVTNAVTGLTVGNSYVIYCFDADYAGGTRTWYAGADPATVMNLGDDVVIAGQITIPATGTSSGGGGSSGSGPGEWCLDYELAVLGCGTYARDAIAGESYQCWNENPDEPEIEMLILIKKGIGYEECYTLVTEDFVELTQSKSTPMLLRNGKTLTTEHMLGQQVLQNKDGVLSWQQIIDIRYVGLRKVVKLSFGDRMIMAGNDIANGTIATHNANQKP